MKSYILLLFIVISICSCKKTVININKQDKEVFSPALKKEILRMFEVKNKEKNKLKVCNIVILQQDRGKDSQCSVIISLSNSMLKKTIPFIPSSDSLNIRNNFNIEIMGYTFIENELVICYLLSDSCNENLVNKNRLIPYNDSVPGYPEILEDYSDAIFENPIRIYKIVGDSLQLINSEWIFP